MDQVRVYPFTIAAGATSSVSTYIGNVEQVYLIHSGSTAWNAGTGNASIYLWGSLGTENVASQLTAFRVQSALIQTHASGKIYNWPVNNGVGGIPRLSLEVGTALTQAANFYLVCSDSNN